MKVNHVIAAGDMVGMPTPVVLVDRNGDYQVRWENDRFNVTLFSKDDKKAIHKEYKKKLFFIAIVEEGREIHSPVYKVRSLQGVVECLTQFLKQ